jgi:hypothetical protein
VDAGGFFSWLNVTAHAEELGHVYNADWTQPGDDGVALSAQMQNLWLRFILAHDPSSATPADAQYAAFFPKDPLPAWPVYSISNNASLFIHNAQNGSSHHLSIARGRNVEQCDLWAQAIPPDWY